MALTGEYSKREEVWTEGKVIGARPSSRMPAEVKTKLLYHTGRVGG